MYIYKQSYKYRRTGLKINENKLKKIKEKKTAAEYKPNIDQLTPSQIVEELDKYIIGQDKGRLK